MSNSSIKLIFSIMIDLRDITKIPEQLTIPQFTCLNYIDIRILYRLNKEHSNISNIENLSFLQMPLIRSIDLSNICV
jgi:hypothetical protein